MLSRDAAITLRRLTSSDADAVRRLAQLDSSQVPDGELLGAEIDGRLVAATSPTTGAIIADPFTRTKEIQEILRLHAAHLRRLSRFLSRKPDTGWLPQPEPCGRSPIQ